MRPRVLSPHIQSLLGLDKDHSNDFNAQVFFTVSSFLPYNPPLFLTEKEHFGTIGILFQDIVDESATITFDQSLRESFRNLFNKNTKSPTK